MDRVFILDYQLQVELVGPTRVGDHVSWSVEAEKIGSFYGDTGWGLSDAWYFAGDESIADHDDDPAEIVIGGEVTEILAVWCQREGPNPERGTVRVIQHIEANHWQRKETPGPGLSFEGYLVSLAP